MMQRRDMILAVAAVVGFCVTTARGSVIYEQLPGTNSTAIFISSTLDNFGGSPGFRVADDFILSGDGVIQDVHWWGVGFGGESFSFTFYADEGGKPGAILLTTGGSVMQESVNVGSGFDPVTAYSAILDTEFGAEGGTKYWLSVFNGAADARWLWLRADDSGNGGVQGINPGPPWDFQTSNMSFQLTGRIVPEPSSVVLMGLGICGLIGIRRVLKRS